MGLFKCKVCVEKDNRITDLKDVITTLQSQVSELIASHYPKYTNTISSNLNSALEGTGLSKEELEAKSLIEQQALALLTGNY